MKTAYIPIPYGRDKRKQKITRIVCHCMGEFVRDIDGQVYYCIDWLKKLKISVHALASPSGVIIRCRRDDQIAWHAKGYNFDSLGIEFLVPGIHDLASLTETIKTPYTTDIQMEAGIKQTLEWLNKFNHIESVDEHRELTPSKPDMGDGFEKQIYLDGIGWT